MIKKLAFVLQATAIVGSLSTAVSAQQRIEPTYYESQTSLTWVSHHYIVDTIIARGYPLTYDLYIFDATALKQQIKLANEFRGTVYVFDEKQLPLYVGSITVDADHKFAIYLPESPFKKNVEELLRDNIRSDGELIFEMVRSFSHHPIVDEVENPKSRPPMVKLVRTWPGMIEWPVFLAVLLNYKGGFKLYLNGVRLWETFLIGKIKPAPQPEKRPFR